MTVEKERLERFLEIVLLQKLNARSLLALEADILNTPKAILRR